MKIKHYKILIITFILVVSNTLFVTISTQNNIEISASENTNQYNSYDELIKKYITMMNTEDFSNIKNYIFLDDLGYNPDSNNFQTLNSNGIELPLRLDKQDCIGLFRKQKEFIESRFGEFSWDNVTYEIVNANSPSKHEQYIDTTVNNVISESEYQKISENYWRAFANERNLNYEEFLLITEYSGEIKNDTKMNILLAKQSGYGPSLRIDFVDDYDYYKVNLSFNGKSKTDFGENDFSILIDNKNGFYRICGGLRWFVPISEENLDDI